MEGGKVLLVCGTISRIGAPMQWKSCLMYDKLLHWPTKETMTCHETSS